MVEAMVREMAALVGLLLLWQVFFRLASSRSAFMKLLAARTRLAVFGLFVAAAAWRFVVHLPSTHWKPQAVDLSQGAVYMLLALLGIEGLQAVVFDYILSQHQKIDVPAIFRDMIRATLYVVVVILIFRFAYNVDVTSLLAASGVLAIMLGFALQTVMADFFASISMQMTRPYSLGDWIKVGEKEGKVEHIDWRATVLRTMYDDYLILPNNKLAHEAIINVSQPTPLHFHAIDVRTPVQHAPARVQEIIRGGLAEVQHIHHDRGYAVYLVGFEESVLVWKVKFWISEYRLYPHIETEVRSRLWYAFQRAGIELPTAVRNVVMHPLPSNEVRASALPLFSRIDWLSALSAEDQEYLAERARLVRYGPQETIVRQGEAGESLFVIWRGTVEIRAHLEDGTVFMRKTLGSGDFFGEISVLTGEPRSADVVALDDAALLVLDKEALRKIVTDDAELICRLLARRQELSREREDSMLQTVPTDDGPTDGKAPRSAELFRKIREFFAF